MLYTPYKMVGFNNFYIFRDNDKILHACSSESMNDKVDQKPAETGESNK